MTISLYIAWHPGKTAGACITGRFEVRNGSCQVTPLSEWFDWDGEVATIRSAGVAVARVDLEASASLYGANASILRWKASREGFAVVPSMVPEESAVAVPDYGVMIARSEDAVRLREPVVSSVEALASDAKNPSGEEITWEHWAARNTPRISPVILGLSRDQRLVEIIPDADTLKASLDFKTRTVEYYLCRASVADKRLERALEGGDLPIFHLRENIGELEMLSTFFVSFADRPLTEENVLGTPVTIAHYFGVGNTFPDGQREEVEAAALTHRPEGEVVIYLRTTVTNRSDMPLVAAQRFPRPFHYNEGRLRPEQMVVLPRSGRLDEHGVVWTADRPFTLHRFNGAVPESHQPTLLLAPGATMTLDSLLAHSPEGLSAEAQKSALDFEAKLAEAIAFWRGKRERVARVEVPEQRLNDFWHAGHAHLELVTLGQRHGPLLAKVGIYTAIGSESIPIVEYYHSVGDVDTAQRCIEFFLHLQHASGRINTYMHYDLETGAVLYLMGLHFAYTGDREWVRSHAGAIRRAVAYLQTIRHCGEPGDVRNGLIAGACADPVETPVAFMLNAYNAAGLRAAAQMLRAVGDAAAGETLVFAEDYTARLLVAVDDAFARGPLLPSAKGRWVPTCAPAAGADGLQMLALDGESCFTHGTYAAYDALLGPLYLVYTGVIPVDDRRTDWLLEINQRHLNRGAIAESQPYYSRHPEVHLLRGERDAFLNAFYSGITALADPETFTFQEHLFSMSPHKTHEEGWALMQMRRMLWLEAGSELRLLSGIPQRWTEPGEVIALEQCGSGFGSFSFRAEFSADARELRVRWEPQLHTCPARVTIDLPNGRLEIAEPMKPQELRFPYGR